MCRWSGCHESTDNIPGRDVIRGLPYGAFIVRGSLRIDMYGRRLRRNPIDPVRRSPKPFSYKCPTIVRCFKPALDMGDSPL